MKNNFCVFRNVIIWGFFLLTIGGIVNSSAQAQCPVDKRLVKMPVSDSKYYLPENYIFKIKFDAPISTDTFKTGSIVQFSVVDNVLGIKLPEFETDEEIYNFKLVLDKIVTNYESDLGNIVNSDLVETAKDEKTKELNKTKADEIKKLFTNAREKLEKKIKNDYDSKINSISDKEISKSDRVKKLETEKAEKLDSLAKMPEVVIVIPKTAKGFGKVEKAKRQMPLFLNYKARISVILDYVLLDNGDCIPIEIRDIPDKRLYTEGEKDFGNIIVCKSENLRKNNKKCIKGRRPQYNFVAPIISGIAAVATILLDNSTAKALAGVTAVEQLSKDDIGDFLNGADAQISDKLIYEVITKGSRVGSFKKPEK